MVARYRLSRGRLLNVESLESRDVPTANFVAAGTDAGVPAVARLIDAGTGQDRFAVAPFGTGFTGGIKVAVGDVTGDKVPDLITAPGSGGGPLVRVFDGVTGNAVAGPLNGLVLFDPNFRGGLNVAAGDVNYDGIADVVAAAGAGGGPVVAVVDGKTGAVLHSFFAYDPSFRGGVSVAVGDVDGDGRGDVITGTGAGGGPHVKVFGIRPGVAPTEIRSFLPYESTFRGGVNVAAGDVNADGIVDIITGVGDGGGPVVAAFRGTDLARVATFLAGDANSRAGVRVGTINGDNGTDLQILAGLPGGVVNRFTGAGTRIDTVNGLGGWVSGSAELADNAAVVWTQLALEAIRTGGTNPPVASRNLALLSTAVFDAVNAIERDYQAYHYAVAGPTGADANAAAHAAGAAILTAQYPAQAAKFQTALAAHLALIPNSPAKTDGIAVGNAAAQDILAFRASDGSATANPPYTPGADPGDWQPTPPANANPLLPGWGNVKPFAIPSVAALRPAAPPALNSAEYAAALNEVKAIGSATSTTRTADQSQIARFWAAGGGTVTPPGMSNQIAQQAIRRSHLDLIESARVLALVNLANADSAIVCWDCKYVYDFWRPITAIRKADTDGNAATDADPTWSSFIVTPPFPSYTSGHSTFSASVAAVLADEFGANYTFRTFSQDVPGASRGFTSFDQAAQEAALSRLYGGIHYSFDNIEGLRCGTAIGTYVAANLLQPV